MFLADTSVTNYAAAQLADHETYARLFHGSLDNGVFVAPSGYETLFPSLAHTQVGLDETFAAVSAVS